MKPHPTIRRTILWGGAAVTSLLALAWLGSGWVWIGNDGCASSPWWSLTIGRFNLGYPGSQSRDSVPGTEAMWLPHYGMRWPMTWERIPRYPLGMPLPSSQRWDWRLQLPLWTPMLIALAPTLIAWRLEALARRRAGLNLCATCEYDRAGIAADAVCPECGVKPTVG